MQNLPKGMIPPEPSLEPKAEENRSSENARSEEYNILGDITKALRALPFKVVVDEAILFESDSSETSVKLSLNVFKPS
ncbi:hypothetical protein [Weizmannia phage Youna2]